MKNKILLAFLLLICQFANAQTRPAAGTTTFASFNPAGVNIIAPVSSSGTTATLFPNGILGFDFSVANSSANNITGSTNAGNGGGKVGIRLNATTTALSTAVVKSNDGSEFQLNSVYMLVNTNPDGQPINFTITGYKDGAFVSGATKTIATSGVNTSYNLFDVSTMSQFNNIDEFRFTHASAALITRVIIDDISITAIPPTITSSTYDASTGVLNVTGTNMGTGTTIDVSKLTFTGIGGATRTLSTTTNVTVTNATSFSVTLAGTDKTAVNALINQNGTSESGGTAYNLGVANNWITNYAAGADLTGNPVTVSNYTPPCTAPTITSNPPNRTICVGNNTTFAAAATGATGYQWQVDVNASGTYTNLSDVAPYSNVTTTTLTITGATAAMSGYRYRMVAINGVSTCFANTNYGILTISNPTLTATQNNVTTFGGNDGTATVAATGGVSSYSYTWSPNVSTTATATGLTAGTYTVTVRDGILCQAAKTFAILQPPNTPSSTVITSSGFTINWGAVTGATSYKLDVSTSNTFSSFVGVYQDFTVSGTSQVISGLAANTPYYFRVRAVSADAGTTNSSGTGSRTTLPLNTAPVANNDIYYVTQGGSITIPVGTGILANDTDVDGDALTASLITWPENSSSFTFHADGSFTYYHDGFSNAADVFTYRANDGVANSNIATVTINVINPVTVSSITRVSAATTNANSVDFTVTFSGAVSGVNASNFSLTSSGLSGVSISAVSGSGATRTVTVNTGTGTGTIRLNLQNVTGISPTVITAVPYTGGQSYTIDRTAPTLTAVTIASNNATTSLAKTGDVVTVSFTASENIASPTATIAGAAATISGSGTTYTATRTMLVTDAQGTVAFSISFGDVAGNAGTAVTATTNSSSVSFDRTAPTLTAVTIASNNATTSLAKTGDVVTVSFTASENIASPTVTIAGGSATISGSGTTYTATRTMLVTDAQGTVPFSISFGDVAGNAGTAVTATTNSSSVSFDRTAPTLTAVTIASNNATTSLAKTGDVVTVSFTASENIASPTVTIAGGSATISGSGTTYTATRTMLVTDAQGTVPFSISFGDVAGNAGTAVTATTNSSSVSFDRTAPTLTAVTIASNNATTSLAKTGDVVTVSFTASENIASPTATIAGGSATISGSGTTYTATRTMLVTDAQGTVPFSISFGDVAGNAGTAVTATTNSSSVSFDRTAPTLTAVTIASNNATTSLAKTGDVVTVSFTASENIASPTVTIAGASATINGSGTTYTATRTMLVTDAQGTVPFSISFGDVAGNAGTAVTATTNSSSVSFDRTAPTLTAVTIASNNATTSLAKTGDVVTVSFTASENIASPTVTIAGGSATISGSGTTYTATRTMLVTDAQGTVPFSISFGDVAGNAGTAVTATTNSSSVSFDRTAPTLTAVTIASNNATTSLAKTGDVVTVSFTASENIASPTVTIAGGSATISGSGTTYTATRTMLVTDAQGTVPFSISFGDVAGNAGTAVTATTNSSSVSFDRTAPTLTAVTIASNNATTSLAKTGDVVTVSFTASENIASPTATIAGGSATISGSGTTYTATRTMLVTDAQGTVPFSISFGDVAGNAGTAVTATTNSSSVSFDRTAPTLTAVTIASNNATTSLAKTGDVVTVSFTASENIASPTATIAGAAATISGSGTTYTATRTMLVTDAQGTVPFSISFGDVAGNAGTPISATTNSSNVIFDRTAPAAPVVLTVANGTTITIATPSITGTAEANATISVAIDGTQVGTTTANGSNNWTFPISTPLTNGSHTVRATATDGAGNISANSNTNTFTVNINPTITATGVLSALTTTYGTASTSTQFTVSGTNLSTAILVTAPTFFEVSTDDITFNNTVTVGTSGTISGTVYVRLKATAPASTYIGNVILSSAGASDETISTASSTVNAKALTATAAAITKIYNNNNTATITFNAFDASTGLVGSDVVSVSYTAATYANENVGTNKTISITGLALTGAAKDNYFLNAFTANGSITAKAITVVLNASPLIAKVYNNSNTAVLAPGNYTLNNVETDDAVTVTGTATYADENVGVGKVVTVSSFVLAGAESNNYSLTTTSASTTGNITAKPITVNLNASPLITKVYNNSNTAVLATGNYTLNNLETGDAVTVTGTATYADENVGIGKVVTVNSFVLAGSESNNYSLGTTSASTTGNITTKPITVSLSTSPLITKVYNNSNAAVLATGNYTLNNVETGDAVTVTGTATYADENIGIGKVVTVNSFVLAGAESSNYNLTTTSAATTGNITAKPITVTLNASPLITKVYNNSNTAVLATGNYTLNNVETGDAVIVTGTASYADKNVGIGKVVTVNSFVLTGAESSNYSLSTTSAATTGNITAKPITVTLNASPLITKLYNNSNAATLVAGNYALNNVETGDAVTVTGIATYADQNVANGKVISANTFILAGTDKDNYNLTTASSTTTGSITPVALTITAADKEKFVGAANPLLTPKFDGFITGETNAVLTTQPVINTTATINSPIGSYPIIASGAVATNYVISYVDGQLIVKAGAPTSISLTNVTLYENRPSGTLAGMLNSTSDDPNATFTYSLVTGTGSADNAKFAIVNNELRTAQILDYEAQAQYNVRVRSTTQHGFSLDQTFVIQLNDVNEVPTLAAISNQTICYTNSQQVVALANITAGPEVNQTTTLTVTNSNPSLFSSFTAVKTAGTNGEFRYTAAPGAAGTATISITVKDSGGIDNGGVDTFTQTFTVTVNPLPVVSISSNIGLSISKGLTVQLTATGGTIYTWANANGIISGQNTAILTVRPSLNTTYTVTVTNANGCTTTKSITLNILDDYVMISGTNILTPNGDGKNDFLIIRNIDLYPNNELKIYDLAGRLIYSKKKYTNDWGGTLNGSPLAKGTYYYIIDFGEGIAKKKGFVSIVRD